ncbi:MAG: restriction endonuclease subunit S, partial [Solirubrobacterales bacterium]|nr:restriction endonuclease subunit S [Solirubrobacterales bacterium]
MTNEEFLANFGHLANAPNGVERLRRLILDLAVRGRLVPQDPNDEPAVDLLASLTANREKRVTEKASRRAKELPPLKAEEAEAHLPAGWAHTRLGEMAEIIRGVTFPGGAKSNTPGEGLVACLRSGNVNGRIRWTDLIYIPEEFVRNDTQRIVPGDIVMSIANSRELVGKIAVVDEDPPQVAAIGGFLAAIRTSNKSLTQYLSIALSSTSTRRFWLSNATQTTNIANISSGIVRMLPVPVPPSTEQERIVKRVDELMALCGELEAEQGRAKDLRASTARSALATVVTSDRSETDKAIALLNEHLDLTLAPGDGATEVVTELRKTILDLAVRGRLGLSGHITDDKPSPIQAWALRRDEWVETTARDKRN